MGRVLKVGWEHLEQQDVEDYPELRVMTDSQGFQDRTADRGLKGRRGH